MFTFFCTQRKYAAQTPHYDKITLKFFNDRWIFKLCLVTEWQSKRLVKELKYYLFFQVLVLLYLRF